MVDGEPRDAADRLREQATRTPRLAHGGDARVLEQPPCERHGSCSVIGGVGPARPAGNSSRGISLRPSPSGRTAGRCDGPRAGRRATRRCPPARTPRAGGRARPASQGTRRRCPAPPSRGSALRFSGAAGSCGGSGAARSSARTVAARPRDRGRRGADRSIAPAARAPDRVTAARRRRRADPRAGALPAAGGSSASCENASSPRPSSASSGTTGSGQPPGPVLERADRQQLSNSPSSPAATRRPRPRAVHSVGPGDAARAQPALVGRGLIAAAPAHVVSGEHRRTRGRRRLAPV